MAFKIDCVIPFSLFSLSVVFVDVGVRNERRLCAINYSTSPGFEVIHGLLDRVMSQVEVQHSHELQLGYHLEACNGKLNFVNLFQATVFYQVQPVLHDWCNKGCCMCYLVCGMMHIKEPLPLIRKSSPCGCSGFPLSLSEWSFTICVMPYNRK